MHNSKGNIFMIVAGTASYVFLGAMYVWSVIKIELVKFNPDFTATQMSLVFTLTMIFFCFGGFFGGKLVDKRSPAFSIRIAAVLVLLGYTGGSSIQILPDVVMLPVFYLFYAVITGFGIGMAYNACMANISPWFPGHVGLVTGIMMMGFGFSSLIYAMVIENICPHIGIFNVIRLIGLSNFIVLIISSFFIKKPPAAEKGNDCCEGDRSVTPREMVSKASFWIYFLWNSLCSAAGLLIINNAANIAEYFGLAASIGFVVSIFNGCGRPFVGQMADKLGQFKSMFAMNLMLVAAAVLLIFADNSGLNIAMLLGLVLVGIIYGGGGTINTKVINEMYGTRYFGRNHSISNFCVIVSSVVGPYMSGVLQDKSNGGFSSTFVMLLIMGLIMIFLIFILLLVVKRENNKITIDK